MDSSIVGWAVVGGLACGALAKPIFNRFLRQDRVDPMKDQMQRLRGAVMSPDIDPQEAARMGLLNLRLAIGVLGYSLLPSAASAAPAVIFLTAMRSVLHTAEDWPNWQWVFMASVLVAHFCAKPLAGRLRHYFALRFRES